MERKDFRRTLMRSMSIIGRKGFPKFEAKSATVANVRYLVCEGEIRIAIECHFPLETFSKKRIHGLSTTMSLLPIINACDNFRVESYSETLYPFYIHVPPTPGDPLIGYLRPSIFAELENYNQLLISVGHIPIWEIVHNSKQAQGDLISLNSGSAGKVGSATHGVSNESRAQSAMVGFSKTLDTAEKRSEAMRIMCEKWFTDGEPFGDLISGKMWRNELYPIYTHRKSMFGYSSSEDD
jgi:hypothetical protein